MNNTGITDVLLHKVLDLVRPTAEMLLATVPEAVWGPGYAIVAIPSFDLPGNWITALYGQIPTKWDQKWGKEYSSLDFLNLAKSKAGIALRGNGATSKIVLEKPWLLEPGDTLWGGGYAEDGISAGASGATASADETIARLVVLMILSLLRIEIDWRIQNQMMNV